MAETNAVNLTVHSNYGRLPLDIFMLERWDARSKDSDEVQRATLANHFVQIGSLGRQHSKHPLADTFSERYVDLSHGALSEMPSPTQAQIDRILAPTLTVSERVMCAHHLHDCVWLRTCYTDPGPSPSLPSSPLTTTTTTTAAPRVDGGGDGGRHHHHHHHHHNHNSDDISANNSDVSHASLVQGIAPGVLLALVGGAEGVLDDRALYDFGADWPRVFRRLPFLLTQRVAASRDTIRRAQLEALEDFDAETDIFGSGDVSDDNHVPHAATAAAAAAATAAAASADGSAHGGPAPPPPPPPPPHPSGTAGGRRPEYSHVQALSVVGFLFVADADALRSSGKVLLVWYDECGRVVRQTRIRPAEVVAVCSDHLEGKLLRGGDAFWARAAVGPAYDLDGVCGPPYAPAEDGEDSDRDFY